MVYRIVIAWICNLIDTIATAHLYMNHEGEELNPISNWLLEQSVTTFVACKLIIMTLAALFMWWKQDMKFCKVASWILFVEYLLVAFYYAIIFMII